MKVYQILTRPKVKRGQERPKWAFVAHGARYTEKEAEAFRTPTYAAGGVVWEYKLVRVS
jgi:hypothetical protein